MSATIVGYSGKPRRRLDAQHAERRVVGDPPPARTQNVAQHTHQGHRTLDMCGDPVPPR